MVSSNFLSIILFLITIYGVKKYILYLILQLYGNKIY